MGSGIGGVAGASSGAGDPVACAWAIGATRIDPAAKPARITRFTILRRVIDCTFQCQATAHVRSR
jgi:hypothetical protein